MPSVECPSFLVAEVLREEIPHPGDIIRAQFDFALRIVTPFERLAESLAYRHRQRVVPLRKLNQKFRLRAGSDQLRCCCGPTGNVQFLVKDY